MSIIQKLKRNEELSSTIQVIVTDETGVYNSTNTNGYGGANGNPISKFEKYIFELVNLYTGNKYRQTQSDNLANTTEFHNPTVPRIANKENVTIDAGNFNLNNFEDGLYKLYMNVQLIDSYTCTPNVGTDVISNVTNAQYIYDNFKTLIGGSDIYKIQGITGNNLIVDRPIINYFPSLKPCMSTSINFIISDQLNDDIDCAIAKTLDSCNCDNSKLVNSVSEIQLYFWAMNRSIDENDIFQAYEYFQIAKELSASLNCY